MNKNADYAIALHVRKVEEGEIIDEGASKFYGSPTLPECLMDAYPDDSVFLAQIRLADIKDMDSENRLPHEGYLYFFLDAEMYPSYDLYVLVDHILEEPKYIVDDYNEYAPIEGLTDTYVITFEKVDGNYNGTKLLGSPSDYIDEYDDKPPLLLQYDPYEFDVPFLASLDGYAYVFMGEKEENKFVDATFEVSYS